MTVGVTERIECSRLIHLFQTIAKRLTDPRVIPRPHEKHNREEEDDDDDYDDEKSPREQSQCLR